MYSAIRIRDLRPDGCNLFEVPAGAYRVSCGPLAEAFEGPLGLFTCEPFDGDPSALPDAPPELAAFVRQHAPRHEVERASYTATARTLRIQALERLLDDARKRPPANTMAWLAGVGDYVTGSLGCRLADLMPTFAEFFLTATFPPAEDEIRAAFVEGLEGGSTWPFNVEGAKLDEAARAADEAAEALARMTREAEGPSPVNEQTAAELGVVVVSILETLVAAPETIPSPLRHLVTTAIGGPSLDAARVAMLSDGEKLYVLIPRDQFFGAKFTPRDIVFGVRFEGDDIIPPGTAREVRAKTTRVSADTRDWLLAARGRRTPPSKRYGNLSLEGRVRTEQARALAEQHAADLFNTRERQVIASACRDGLELEPAVVARVLRDAMLAAWDAAHQKPSGWDADEERKASTVVHVLPGDKRIPYLPKPWRQPPFPMTDAEIFAVVDSAPVMFLAGELVKEPSPGVIDAVLKAAPYFDPFADIIASTIEGRKTIRTSEVEDALRKEGKLGDGELRNGERQRIALHLERLGGRKDREGTSRVWRFEA